MRFKIFTISLIIASLFTGFFIPLTQSYIAPLQVDPWYQNEWIYRRKLTFNNTLSSENLTDFTVLIYINDTYMDWSHIQNLGQDLLFTDNDGTTKIPHEIELWNDTHEAFIHFNVPQIDANSNNDYVYMYYGNPSALDQQNVTGTWNNEYIFVHHLHNDSGIQTDSTSNNNDGVVYPISWDQTKWSGDSLYFDGANDYITIPSSQDFNQSEFTMELWFNITDSGSGFTKLMSVPVSSNNFGYWMGTKEISPTNFQVIFQIYFGGGNIASIFGQDLSVGNYLHVVCTYSESLANMTIYCNTTLRDTDILTQNYTRPANFNFYFNIDKWNNGTVRQARYYNRVINQTEIEHSFNSGSGNNPLNQTGLLGWWKFNETEGNVLHDTILNHDGTLYGYPPIASTGQINDAIDIDGLEDYIIIENDVTIQITGDLTLEAWVKPDALSADQRIFHKNWAKDYSLYVGLAGGWYKLRFQHGDGSSETLDLSPNNEHVVTVGTWTYLAAVRNTTDTTVTGYVDGTLKESPSYVKTPITDASSLYLGSRQTFDRFFNGSIDEFRISNISRSDDWIEAQYLSMTQQFVSIGSETIRIVLTVYFQEGINLYINGTLRSNSTEIDFLQNEIANVTSIVDSDYVFFKYIWDSTNTLDNPIYLNMTQSYEVFAYGFSTTNAGIWALVVFALILGFMGFVFALTRR